MTDPTALPNFSPRTGGDNEPALQERILAALAELELTPTVDEEGDIAFVFSDQQMFIRATDQEADIVRVFGQWQLQEPVPTDPAEQLNICNDLNVSFNLIKAAIAGNTLLVTSEHLLPRGADVRGLLSVAIPLVLQAVHLWHQRATGQSMDEALDGQLGELATGNDGTAAPGDGAS